MLQPWSLMDDAPAPMPDPTPGAFPNALAEFVFVRTYARWRPDLDRRETWPECVERVVAYLAETAGPAISAAEWAVVQDAILQHRVRPSSRLLAMAGPAADACHITAYNCSYLPIDSVESFAEVLYILMAGTGVGFSVERRYIEQLPVVQLQCAQPTVMTFLVPDTTEGWADALKFGLNAWLAGVDVRFDYRRVRPAGARLMTKGGRASGPASLCGLLDYCRDLVLAAQGRQLTSAECHHIVTKIGDVVVMGGVRRSAEISLSDRDDTAIRDIKQFGYWETAPHLSMANNSAVYEVKPGAEDFAAEWEALARSGSGERGIFNRQAAHDLRPARRNSNTFGTNPCGEITLQSQQLCNLSEVVARADDTAASLAEKVRIASLIGTVQSMLVDFPYLRPAWRLHCEEERLLGVSVTGQMDCPAFRDADTMDALLRVALETNRQYAERLGIAQSAAVTCVKPSGNSSQMADCASGMHPRYAPYYLRRVRIASTDPLYRLVRDSGAPLYPENGQTPANATSWVTEFPVAAPAGAMTREAMTALEQLEYWLLVKEHWTEHNPSQTIYVKTGEWDLVRDWVYDHWERIGGLSFLPFDDHIYPLAPYQPISAEEYTRRMADFPVIDYRLLGLYEREDETTGAGEFACVGPQSCDI